jgi:hypothetical protein
VITLSDLPNPSGTSRVLFTLLPGPDRKRGARPYRYRLTYRNADAEAVGCVMLWEVSGGRLDYQIALEREETGNLRCHCTCADAVYRAEDEGRFCKHIQGLLAFGRPARHLPQVLRIGA